METGSDLGCPREKKRRRLYFLQKVLRILIFSRSQVMVLHYGPEKHNG